MARAVLKRGGQDESALPVLRCEGADSIANHHNLRCRDIAIIMPWCALPSSICSIPLRFRYGGR